MDRRYDLEERTTKFSEAVLDFIKKIPKDNFNQSLIIQLIRSVTSIGANYCEADDAESRKDFKHKIGICKKESREVKYWLRLIVKLRPELRNEVVILWQEAKELNLIFNAINNSLKIKMDKSD